ncbi:UNVERIFIED_CONTAM: hypothetical protein GTU68_028818 [Idotea baltica]|nr:hypothetical protein [Idotea baltica]
MASNNKFIPRDISWLSFNERVLQEAEDETVPLLERLKFLGIYSNNQDEFFRVRVAVLKRLTKFDKEAKKFLGKNPISLLDKIQKRVVRSQARFDNAYFLILDELKKENIYFVNEQQLTENQEKDIEEYFISSVRHTIYPIILSNLDVFPALKDRSIYLAIKMINSSNPRLNRYSIVEIPTDQVSRFYILPSTGKQMHIIFLDDIIRHNLPLVYQGMNFDQYEAYTFKITRDAELDLENDVSQSLIELLGKGIKKRSKGEPTRFIYDQTMPKEFLNYLSQHLGLKRKDNFIPGERYHNFKDFINFPDLGLSQLKEEKHKYILHPELHKAKNIFSIVQQKDILLHFPYHSFNYYLDFLREAALDPSVTRIFTTAYRIGSSSNVMAALINAARNGKEVTIFIELKARFDEENNIAWSSLLQEEGVKVISNIKGLKVHAKVTLIERRLGGHQNRIACVSTGNFHESNAKLYTDYSLFTSNNEICNDLNNLFTFLETNYKVQPFKHLTVSPFTTRSKLINLINLEIAKAKENKAAFIFIKVNNLVEKEIISQLYVASKLGVKIKIIARSTCSIIAGLDEFSENIQVISILDKFLEHSRVFIFGAGSNPEVFLSSADIMNRNLDYRVEVICPILKEDIKTQLIQQMEIIWEDNCKARIIDKKSRNNYRKKKGKDNRSQIQIYNFWAQYFKDNT